jgi:hypothetical protein
VTVQPRANEGQASGGEGEAQLTKRSRNAHDAVTASAMKEKTPQTAASRAARQERRALALMQR